MLFRQMPGVTRVIDPLWTLSSSRQGAPADCTPEPQSRFPQEARMKSSGPTPGRVVALPRGADDVLTVFNKLERGAPFCANPACALHVRLADSQVEGGGKLG